MSDLTDARAVLRQRQTFWARPVSPLDPLEVLHHALAKSAERQAGFVPEDGYLRNSVFRYDPEREAQRFALTDEIIRRAMPGPHEDPIYLEMLARQAASVEYVLRSAPAALGTRNAAICDRVVLGTIGQPSSHAFSQRVGDGIVLAMSGGMMDWMYQAAKANVLAWPPNPDTPEGRLSFGSDPDAVAAGLDADPGPVELLSDTLAAWLYDGVPRVSYSTAPPERYHPPLELLINGAERFVLAHEYGHVFLHHFNDDGAVDGASTEPEDSWLRELQADAFAITCCIISADELDMLPANVGLQGAVVAMHTHATLDKALSLATTGTAQSVKSGTHPPFEVRLEQLTNAYLAQFPDPAAAADAARGMHVPQVIGDLMFDQARQTIEASYRAGRMLHPVWSIE